MGEEIVFDVESIIGQLLEMRSQKPGKRVNLKEQEILGLISGVKELFMKEEMLVAVEAPLRVCGDIHGQYVDLLRLLEYGGLGPESSYLFLGDYVDRGRQSIECLCLLFALKMKLPGQVTMLRGNHECKNRYSIKLWKAFVDCFNCMPVAALISRNILCMHGGLSPDMASPTQISQIPRPTDVPDTGILCDLLWADPDRSVRMWSESERGVSFGFGEGVVQTFLKKNQLDLICRAHQVVEDGYEFFFRKQLVTLFSAPNYCGEFNNSGAMMDIDPNLCCSFKILLPHQKGHPYKNPRPHTPGKGKH